MSENERLWGAIAVLRGRMREILDIVTFPDEENDAMVRKEAEEALRLTSNIRSD
jgi:hypothetical protein